MRAVALFALCAMAPVAGHSQGPIFADGFETGDTSAWSETVPTIVKVLELVSLWPSWGSALTQVRVEGAGFSAVPTENTVRFGGVVAEVLVANPTDLVVRPPFAVNEPLPVLVNVEVGGQFSNGLVFEVVPSGHTAASGWKLPTEPTGVVELGGSIFIAAGGPFSSSAGLYELDAAGVTRQRFQAPSVAWGDPGPGRVFDGPVALASDGTDVFFTTVLGAVRRYEVSTGRVFDVLSPSPTLESLPPRTGLVFDSGGYLYVVDRTLNGNGGIVRLAPDGTVSELEHSAFAFDGSAGLWGIATDGTDLFLTDEADDVVIKVVNAQNAATVIDAYSTGATAPRGIAIVSGELIVSSDGGLLQSAPVTTGGALAVFGAVSGYGYRADSLSAGASGDLLLAQPESSAVRELPTGVTDAVVIAAGIRPALGTAYVPPHFYFASTGQGFFGGAPPVAAAPDGVLLAVDELGGTSRVVVNRGLPGGLVADDDSLIVSDCLESRIYSLDPAIGAETDLLTDADGLLCPSGLHLDALGDLYYVNDRKIGRLTRLGVNTLDHVDGLPDFFFFFLAAHADTLLTSALGPSDGTGVDVLGAPLAAGGTASVLVPASAAGDAMALSVSPHSGRARFHRPMIGDLVELDPATGDVWVTGSTLLDGLEEGSSVFSMGFAPDDTIVMMDVVQLEVLLTAP